MWNIKVSHSKGGGVRVSYETLQIYDLDLHTMHLAKTKTLDKKICFEKMKKFVFYYK